MKVLGNDEQTITGIYGPNEEWRIITNEEIKKIACYIEDGDTPWFAVYDEKGVCQRVNSRFVECVIYER
jgi:hypothetical protein